MKILLLAIAGSPYSRELSCRLRDSGQEVVVLDIFNNRISLGSTDSRFVSSDFYQFFYSRKILGTMLKSLLLSAYLLKSRKNYNVINIHYNNVFYSKYLIPVLKGLRIPVVTSVWGSDFLRSSHRNRNTQKKIYDISKLITFNSESVKSSFLDYYGMYQDKACIVRFGLDSLDMIDNLSDENISDVRVKMEIPQDRTVITCGYNAYKAQNHLAILESLSKLGNSDRKSIFLLIPMSYGGNPQYIDDVTIKCTELGIDHVVITEFLSPSELAASRSISDIFIHMQESDSFSASVQEALYTGNLLLNGDWIDYTFLRELGIEYTSLTDFGELSGQIRDYLEKREKGEFLISDNAEIIRKISSWDMVIDDWLSIYHRSLERNNINCATT